MDVPLRKSKTTNRRTENIETDENLRISNKMTDPTKETAMKDYTLEKDCELRFEIESKTQVIVEVRVCLHFEFSEFPNFS